MSIYTIEDAIEELKKARRETPIRRPLPDDAVIAGYEAQLGFEFNTDFIKLVKETGYSLCGGNDIAMLDPTLDSSRDLVRIFNDARILGMPENWLPFCEDNADFYCLLPDGSVRFLSHDGPCDDAPETWESLAIWVRDVWIGGN